jgi:hypothetical protein
VIFRRRSSGKPEGAEPEPVDEFDGLESDRSRGPWDRSETNEDAGNDAFIDLGGLVVKGRPDLELRLQVDEQDGSVAEVMFTGPESGLELRAFAAPRSAGIWDDVRKDLAAEAARRGGTATEVDGEFGTELKLVMPVQTPEGRSASQPSRVVGVDGPRWLLRGTFLGKSAVEPDPEGPVECAFREVIVVRGSEPMAPRDMLPMAMPAQAQSAISGQPGAAPVPDDVGDLDDDAV